ncbi:MAG: response regulator transcription factor [Gallionella sp.]|nr:MAG: response regulator transcription factor [Gallionella sp.]
MIRIALVEDNADLLDDLAFNLRQSGYQVAPLPDGVALDAWLAKNEVDVLVLDLGLPGENGWSIAQRMRRARAGMGIIMLTAHGALDQRIKGLEQGADAYLVKPVDMRELAATIRTVARRLNIPDSVAASPPQIHWILHTARMSLKPPDGNDIPLTHSECRILQVVAQADGNLVHRKTLIEALGEDYHQYDERRLEALISRLRRKLAAHHPPGVPVRGVKGHGYLFTVDLVEG